MRNRTVNMEKDSEDVTLTSAKLGSKKRTGTRRSTAKVCKKTVGSRGQKPTLRKSMRIRTSPKNPIVEDLESNIRSKKRSRSASEGDNGSYVEADNIKRSQSTSTNSVDRFDPLSPPKKKDVLAFLKHMERST